MSDADTTPVGAGTLTVEIGRGKLDPATELDSLNGGEGIRRGRISITTGSGDTAATAIVDLSAVVTVDDVLDAINNQTQVNVRAAVSGDRIILENPDGGLLTVREHGSGHAAEDLGIAGISETGRIEGADVVNLVDSTLISSLNDGNGVRRDVRTSTGDFRITAGGGDTSFVVTLSDFLTSTTRLEQLNSGNGVRMDDGSGAPPGIIRITDRSGASTEIDLSTARTIEDVLERINAADIGIRATRANSYLMISDTTETPEGEGSALKIEDVSGFAARDLGIAGETENTTLTGSDIYRVATVGDVVRAINYAEGNEGEVTASLSGNGIELTYNTIGSGGITVEAVEGPDGTLSFAAADLGIEGEHAGFQAQSRDLIAGMNTVLLRSLNGGSGVQLGGIRITDRAGGQTLVDLTGAQTVQDVLDRINETTGAAQIRARVNDAGNGIAIVDETGLDAGFIRVEESGGTTAADLGLLGQFDGTVFNGTNAQLQYISEATRLEDLNFGQGVRPGKLRLTNSLGAGFTINVTENQTTVNDILRLINAFSDVSHVVASINENGDGILLTDNAGGPEPMRVDDEDGGTAVDLRIAGEAREGENFIDGTTELSIDIDADDTLNDVVSKINDAGGRFSASVVNDGSATNPFRLSVASDVSGRRGELIFDVGATGLAMQTLVEARDAVFFLGDGESENPIIVSSSNNSVSDVIDGVTLNLVGTSDDPVTLSVTQDLDRVIADLKSFVSTYNEIQDRIDEYTDFDADTETRGVLLGDGTVRRIQDRLSRSVLQPYDAGPRSMNRLFDVGIRLVSGARLEFDEDKFREAYDENPDIVEQLFTADDGGIGAVLEEMLDEITRSSDGMIDRQNATLQQREDDLNSRIEAMQLTLDGRRSLLERQFQALESALSQLGQQQNALAALSAQAGAGG
jgi:flagellar hook-associated protein 2